MAVSITPKSKLNVKKGDLIAPTAAFDPAGFVELVFGVDAPTVVIVIFIPKVQC